MSDIAHPFERMRGGQLSSLVPSQAVSPGILVMSIDDAKTKEKARAADRANKGPKPKRKRYRSLRHRMIVRSIQFVLIAYATVLLVLIGLETRLVYPGAYMEMTTPAA